MPIVDMGVVDISCYVTLDGNVRDVGLLKTRINNYFPSYMRTNTDVEQFSNGLTEIFADFKESIDNMQFYLDSEKIKNGLLDTLGNQLALSFPKGTTNYKKKIQIRDAIESYRNSGTERALKRVFRLIGWDVSIDYCWTIDPNGNNNIQVYYNDTVAYSDTTNYVYSDNNIDSSLPSYIVFGNEYYDINGKLKVDTYDDFGNTWTDLTVYGESYSNGIPGIMIKLPYIRLTINSTDYDSIASGFIDQNTGKYYSYTESEEFAIIDETIQHFLNEGRPANVVIIDLVSKILFSDIIQNTLADDMLVSSQTFSMAYDGSWAYGIPINPYADGKYYDVPKYGTTVNQVTPAVISTDDFLFGQNVSGAQEFLPTTLDVDINIDLPTESVIEVFWTDSDRYSIAIDNANWYSLTVIDGALAGGSWSSNLTNANAIYIDILTPSTSTDIKLKVTHNVP